jgi:hypothetical protein
MRSNRPQGAASNPRGHHFRVGVVRVLSVTAVAATACAMMAGAASAATAAPAALTTTTTAITNANPGTVDAGKPYVIDVTVAPSTATGTVNVVATSPTGLPPSYSCSFTLTSASDGTGSCTVTPGAGTFGDVGYVAKYSGDATDAASTSPGFTLVVPETTTTGVSPATAAPGSVKLTAVVVGQAKDNISPSAGGSGTVTFYNGGAVIAGCAAAGLTYDGGGANLATCAATLAAGTYTITAKYSGDPNNLASSGTETLTVKAPAPTKHATKTSGSAKPTSTKLRRVVTLSATVTSPGRTPGGKVTFMWRGHVVCSARLSHGKAHCAIEFLKTGTYRIRAWYAGNSTFDGSHSAFFAVKIKK